MAPRHEYDLRVSSFTHSYEVAEDIKPFRAKLESDELIVPHETGEVTLEKLHEFIFVDEGEDDDPEYVENSGESDDSLEYESENETPPREYELRATASTISCDVDLKPVTVNMEWEQLIVPHEEGAITLEKLKEFVFEDEDLEEDPEYEESIADSEDSLEYESANETFCRDYGLRLRTRSTSCDVDDLEPITAKLEWDQLIVPHQEEDVTLEKLEEFIFEDEDVEEDPEYEECIVESEDSLEYESDESHVEDDHDLDASQDKFGFVVTRSLVENENINWSYVNKAEEYISSFGVSQFGFRLMDSGLSVIETPISCLSPWMTHGVRSTRRHLRAARRAGEKVNVDSCKARSLLVQMCNLFPLSVALESLGVGLVESTLYEKKNPVMDEDDIEDPEYLLSSEYTEDSLEFSSEVESEEDLISDLGSESSDGEEDSDSIDGRSEVEVSDSIGNSEGDEDSDSIDGSSEEVSDTNGSFEGEEESG